MIKPKITASPLRLPQQHNFADAAILATEAVARQDDEQLRWLGAQRSPEGQPTPTPSQADVWLLPALNDVLYISRTDGRVYTCNGADVSPFWRILILHYMGVAQRPVEMEPAVTFGDLPSARAYAGVHAQRTTARLCATVGRTMEPLQNAAAALGAMPSASCAGMAVKVAVATVCQLVIEFRPMPRLAIRLIWHAGDEEFPPSATLLYPPNIESFFCAEDVIVLSERLVSRLCGKPF